MWYNPIIFRQYFRLYFHCWYFLSIVGMGIIEIWDKKSIAVFEVERSFCLLKSVIIKSYSILMRMVQKLTRFGRPNKISIVNLLKHASYLNTSPSTSPSNPTILSMIPQSCISSLFSSFKSGCIFNGNMCIGLSRTVEPWKE